MLIEWLGHSCFRITDKGYSLVIDPYRPGMVPGLGRLHVTTNKVICSHNHDDHNYVDAVTIVQNKTAVPFAIKSYPSFHDEEKGKKRGKNSITLIESNGIRVAHLGDLGCELDKKTAEKLKNIDALMIPVGGHFTIGPAEAKKICDDIEPRVIIPMHYQGKGFGFSVLARVDAFASLFPSDRIKRYSGNSIEIDQDTARQLALLSLCQ